MGRAIGANAQLRGGVEATLGVAPAANFRRLPFISHTLGEERKLITSDLLGQGREPQDPTPDVANNVGDVVVPVDARNFGIWLTLFFGPSVDAQIGATGFYTHTFTSGAASLPAMSLEVGMPEIPDYSVNYGMRGDKLKISMTRSGLLNATCSLIGIGTSASATASVAPAAPLVAPVRFAQASGSVRKDGQALGYVVSADFTYDNNLDPIESIQADGRIQDSDPGMVMMSGSVRVRYADQVMLGAAQTGTPMELDFGWANGQFGLNFGVPRIFLPRPKLPISGPKGIEVTYDWQASGANGNSVVVALQNDRPAN